MVDRKIEELAGKVLQAISDPKVCGYGADALRKQIKDQLREANRDRGRGREPVPNSVIDASSRHVAGRVEEICRGLPPTVRAVGTVVAAAGAVYGVSQMSEEEIKDAIAKIRVDVVDTKIQIAGQPVRLGLSTTLAPLFGDRPSPKAEAKWQQEIFGYEGTASIFANDLNTKDRHFGAKWKRKFDGGSTEFGAHNKNGGTIYFKLEMKF